MRTCDGRAIVSSMPTARLSPLDATFLHVEDDVSHMHIGSVGIFEGPPPAHADVLATIESKLHLVPRYRQRVRFVPFQAGRPLWIDDPHFRLGYHVRRTALPAPGDDEQLHILVGRVMSQQLDRSRPLWEMWIVEGVRDSRWALISKLHHAMVDGIAGSNLLGAILDARRDAPPAAPEPWTPAPEPRGAQVVAGALAELAVLPFTGARDAAGALRDPAALAARAGRALQGMGAYAGLARPADPAQLNGPIGPHRRWDTAQVQISDVRAIRSAFGGTLNDVVLSIITAGFRDLLLARGEPAVRPVRSLVPVSVRPRGDGGMHANQVSAMFAELPVGIADPVVRLRAVTAHMAQLKASHEAEAGVLLTAMTGLAPETVLSLGGRLGTRMPQHSVTTVTTNVPGPQQPLYLGGRRMLGCFPYVPIAGHVRIGVAIYSYDGALGFGVTGDYDAAPDIGVLCAGVERDMAALLSLTPRRAAPRPPARRRGAPSSHSSG